MLAEMSDIDAARLVLGDDGRMHQTMVDLNGADQCIHMMAGSGAPLRDVAASSPMGSDAVLFWIMNPYRHHVR